MSLFSSLKAMFSGSPTAPEQAEAAEAVEYKGFTIEPRPQPEGGQYRVAALITKGEQQHQFIRSDVIMSRDECIQITLFKTRMMIDQQGDRIFGGDQ